MPSDRVVVLLKGYLGDAVLVTPLLRGLAGRNPHLRSASPHGPLPPASRQGEELTVWATDAVHDLLRSPDLTYRRLSAVDVKGLAKLFREARKLRAEKFGVAIVVNRSFRTALLARLARIPMRIGHATEGRSALLTHRVSYDLLAPEARSYADLAGPLGVEISDLVPRLFVSREESDDAGRLLDGIDIGYQPGARYPAKRIPIAAGMYLAQHLMTLGRGYVLLGGREEAEPSITYPGARSLIGELGLRESMAVASRLRVLVGGDTGFMHVAAAVGCPTVTVYGPTSVEKWGRHDPPHQIVRGAHGDISNVTGPMIVEAVAKVMADG